MTELHTGLVISHLGKGVAVEVDNKIILCQTPAPPLVPARDMGNSLQLLQHLQPLVGRLTHAGIANS